MEIIKYVWIIPLISSCCDAGFKDIALDTEDDIKHFRYTFYAKTYIADRTRRDKENEYNIPCKEWIKQEKYKDSIYNVITTAIADCLLKRNEFAEEKIKEGIVTFENKRYEDYKAENWNALVLYNYIQFILTEVKKSEEKDLTWTNAYPGNFYRTYIENKRMSKACGGKYDSQIEGACDDIIKYDNTLHLENIIKHIRQGKIGDIVYDVGTGKYRRIRYDFDQTYLSPNAKRWRDEHYLTVEIANNKIARILSYNKDGIDEIEPNDYLEIKHKKRIYDIAKNQKISYTIDLSKNLTDITPPIIIEWYEDDAGIHINKVKEDLQMYKAHNTQTKIFNEDERFGRGVNSKIKIAANGKYKARNDDGEIKEKAIFLGSKCFKDINKYAEEWSSREPGRYKWDTELDIDLNANTGSVILPDDCRNLFSDSEAITSIRLNLGQVNAESLANICNNCKYLNDVCINIKSAPNLNSIKGMLMNNSSLKKASIRIDTQQLTDMSHAFKQNPKLETITLSICEQTPPERREIEQMFAYSPNIKTIAWGDTTWIKYMPQEDDKLDELFQQKDKKGKPIKDDKRLQTIKKQIKAANNEFKLIVDPKIYDAILWKRGLEEELSNEPPESSKRQGLLQYIEQYDKAIKEYRKNGWI